MTLRARPLCQLGILAALLAGCGIDPFETPSAYEKQKYLCDDRDLLDAEATRCDEEGTCTGVLSFQGEIEGVPIRVDSALSHSLARVVQGMDGVKNLSTVMVSGAAPYFHFDIDLSSIGIPWADKGTEADWSLAFGTPSKDTMFDFEDGIGTVQWRILAGTDSATLESLPDEGTIGVTYLSDRRIELDFSGAFGPEDDIDACAIVFPEHVEIAPLP